MRFTANRLTNVLTVTDFDTRIEYADETEQDIVSYQDYLFDKPAELLFALSEYFQLDADDSDGDFDDEQSGE